MSIKLLLTTADNEEVVIPSEGASETYEMLDDPAHQDMAFELKGLFETVVKELVSSIEVESKLTLELSGTISYKGKGDASFLVFNVGGETSRTNQMKITLSTSIKPSL